MAQPSSVVVAVTSRDRAATALAAEGDLGLDAAAAQEPLEVAVAEAAGIVGPIAAGDVATAAMFDARRQLRP